MSLSVALAIAFAAAAQAPPPDNLARAARATASESQDDLTPEKAIDGTTATRWSGIPGHNSGVWFALEWPAPVRIGEVAIRQHDRYTFEMDVQVFDAAANDWRTVEHIGSPGERLPKVVIARFDPIESSRLRIGNITNGPSFTEVDVFAASFAEGPVTCVASDLRGNLIGIVTDRYGAEPVAGASVAIRGRGRGGEWSAAATSDAHGLFAAPMPLGLAGEVLVETSVTAGNAPRRATIAVEAASLSYGLTPTSFGEKPIRIDSGWKFAPNPPEAFFEPSFDDASWRDIAVPAHWEMEGFSPESGVGGYRVRLPRIRFGGRVKLRFDGVYSGAEAWLDGAKIAEHEGGFTPFEVDVTDLLRADGGVLALRVREHTTASDDLDKASQYADFPLAGIIRKVTLFPVPDAHVGSLEVTTTFDDGYRDATLRARVAIVNESNVPLEGGSLRASLFDPDGRQVECGARPVAAAATAWGRADVDLALPVAAPRKWEAEHPNLHLLRLELFDSGNALVQRLEQRVGFRQTDVRGTEILIDGSPVKFRGTCHHDSHPTMGRAVTEELTRRDLTLIKEANLNALRTSHYPPVPELLDIADEIGLYVEDEAPFCWVGVADDLRNTPRILQLTAELLARDRNHPSVFMWSLCNESSFGYGFERSHEWVRAADPSRPTGAATSAWTEIATLHNPITIQRIDENETIDKPLLFDESFCIFQGIWNDVAEMWVDPGIRDYWVEPLLPIYDRLMKSRVTQGSMIWCWADDIFCVPHRGFEYGRNATRSHFLDATYALPGRGLVGDAPWGIVDGWRRPKPESFHVKKLHSPIRIDRSLVASPDGLFHVPVENQFDFTDLSELTITWSLGNASGVARAAVPPRTRGDIALELKALPAASESSSLALRFEDGKGRLVDEYEIRVGAPLPTGDTTAAADDQPLRILDEETLFGSAVRVVGGGFELAFDRSTGALRRGVVDGEPVLLEMPMLHVLPTGRALEPLPDRSSFRLEAFDALANADGAGVDVTIAGRYDGFTGRYDIRVSPDRSIRVRSSFTRTGDDVLAREIGLRLSVPRRADTQIVWRRDAQSPGEGWHAAYPPDHIGAPSGSAMAFEPTGDGPVTERPYAQDNSPLGSNGFRGVKRHFSVVRIGAAGSVAVEASSNGSKCARAIMESDRASLHILDWYGGTGAGLWEWKSNYGEGRLVKKGEILDSEVDIRLDPAPSRRIVDDFR